MMEGRLNAARIGPESVRSFFDIDALLSIPISSISKHGAAPFGISANVFGWRPAKSLREAGAIVADPAPPELLEKYEESPLAEWWRKFSTCELIDRASWKLPLL
jgi:hypothetical protein